MIQKLGFFKMFFVLLLTGLIVAWPAKGGQKSTKLQIPKTMTLGGPEDSQSQKPPNFQTQKTMTLSGPEDSQSQKSTKPQIQKASRSYLKPRMILAKSKKLDPVPSSQSASVNKGSGEQRVPKSSLKKTEKPQEAAEKNQTVGIILEYRKFPPSEKEQTDTLQTARENHLVKTDQIPSSRLWIFSWKDNNKKDSLLALLACAEFNKLSFIKSCQPNYVFHLNRSPDKSFFQKGPVLPEQGQKLDRVNALQTCNIIQSHQPQAYSNAESLAGRYWAQNMIGSDLLRAEIQKKKHQCQTIS